MYRIASKRVFGHRTYAKIREARLRALKQADQLPIFSTDESIAICELMYGRQYTLGPTDNCPSLAHDLPDTGRIARSLRLALVHH